jgi:HAT1-interacting factor 1
MLNNVASEETNRVAQKLSVEEAMEHGKRAFALRKYEQAVDYYATALELKCVLLVLHLYAKVAEAFVRTQQSGEDSPENADLYFAYGKALLENAISQSSVLGKDQGEEGADGGLDNGGM